MAISHCLHNRISSYISDSIKRQEARKDTCYTLQVNGYPYKHTYPTKTRPLPESPFISYTSLPYVQGTTKKIRRSLNEIGVNVAMKPICTIGLNLPSPKDTISPDEKTCALYEIACSDCEFVYVGQTKRNLNDIVTEHRSAIRQQKPENSALCKHVMESDHLIGWNKSRVLKTETNYSKRLTAESWFINSRPKVLNRSHGESFPWVYRPLL